jgi:3-hydroxymyristoyl/3-hydroxydecanoyl-(acyl carrier protein) dehydratase
LTERRAGAESVFHFVDRIVELDPGKHALGVRHVTAADAFLHPRDGAPCLLSCIVGEALGQLGAWNVMAANDFTLRPVAGIARNVRILGEVHPGDAILLDTTIDSVDDEVVRYHAVGSVRGKRVMVLEEGLGPFLPLEQFNDPSEVQGHFDRIHRPGEVAEALEGAPVSGDGSSSDPAWLAFDEILSREAGSEIEASKRIDGEWPFFADHFPRMPVFPMSLLLECILRLGEDLLPGAGTTGRPNRLRPGNICRVKMSRFVEPGRTVVVRAQIKESSSAGARVAFRCKMDGKRVLVADADYLPRPEAR